MSSNEPVAGRSGPLRRWDARFRPHLPHGTEAGIALLLTGALAYLDLRAGPFVDFAIFYFVPIFIAAWAEGLWLGLVIAAVATLANHVTEDLLLQAAGAGFTRTHLFYQDAAHLLMFGTVAWLSGTIKRQGDRLAAEHALALSAQGRVRSDLEAAHRVQESLMSHSLTGIPRVEAAMAYRFARHVGGDLVDVRRRGARLAVCVADVSGKGAQAALMAIAVKGWLDRVRDRFIFPGAVAEYINRRLCECVPSEMFLTLTYVVLNTQTGELRAVVAGHEPPLLQRGGASGEAGKVSQIGPTGPALGLVTDARFEEVALSLSPGDLMLFYTDGLTTARTESGERTGLRPTMDLLARPTDGDLETLVNDMLATCLAADGEPDDDVAILALRWVPTAVASREPEPRLEAADESLPV